MQALGSQWVATGYVGAISMLLTFLYGRMLGPDGFGDFSYILTLGSLFAILQDGGFRTLIFRESTSSSYQNASDKFFSMALGHILIVTLVGITLLLVIPFENRILPLLAIISFGFGTFTIFISSQLKGEGEFEKDAWWKILTRTLTAGFIVVFILLISPQMEWIFLGWIAGNIVSLLFRFKMWFGKLRMPEWDKNIYTSIIHLIIIDVATLVYFKIDIVMLKYLGLPSDQIGFYAASSRLMEGLIFIHLPFAVYFFRGLRLESEDRQRFLKLTNKLLVAAVISPVIIVPVGLSFGETILELCYGSKFVAGYAIFQLLIMALFFMIPNLVVTQAVLAINREKYYAAIAFLCALLNITLNFFLIPKYGAQGAVVGTLATEGFLLIAIGVGVYILRKGGQRFKYEGN